MGEDITRGNEAATDRGIEAPSGWVTTQQAARALGITARTVRWHIDKGNLEAISQGEGVQRAWLVSIDSLQAFRDVRQTTETRQITGDVRETIPTSTEHPGIAEDIPGNAIRELADRLVEEAARASEYRVRLELTERAQSTLEDELVAERRSREAAEKERDELRSQLEALQASPEPPESPVRATPWPGRTETPDEDTGDPQASKRAEREAASDPRGWPASTESAHYGTSPQEAQESLQRRSWWRRWLGF
jgi:hypothetical protein